MNNIGKVLITNIFLMSIAYGQPTHIQEKQKKLLQIERKIQLLEKNLSATQDKRKVLNNELKKTDKNISVTIKKIGDLNKNSADNVKQINSLNKHRQELNSQLEAQQKLLSQHLLFLYKTGNNQPIRWLFNMEQSQKLSHMISLNNYLITARIQAINEILKTKKELKTTQAKLTKALTAQQVIKSKLQKQQSRLNNTKKYNNALVQKLDQSIKGKTSELKEYQQNKKTLANLIEKISAQQKSSTTTPTFPGLPAKLPMPLKKEILGIKPLNQGVAIKSIEGTQVYAVAPGEIVFNDWLNGYGLLVIINHGNGFMSLYGHNQALFRNIGDKVDTNSQIATVGHSGGLSEEGLYFEIRHRGNALPPLKWLH